MMIVLWENQPWFLKWLKNTNNRQIMFCTLDNQNTNGIAKDCRLISIFFIIKTFLNNLIYRQNNECWKKMSKKFLIGKWKFVDWKMKKGLVDFIFPKCFDLDLFFLNVQSIERQPFYWFYDLLYLWCSIFRENCVLILLVHVGHYLYIQEWRLRLYC